MTTNFPLTLLYDGACPVCNLEMDNLKARNTAGLLKFVDIAVPFFDPAPYGTSLEAMNGLIHAMRPNGSLVIGTQVFRLAYGAVGLGHLAAPTGWPLLRPAFDVAYKVFARNRYGISSAVGPLLLRIAAWRANRRSRACAESACDVPARPEQTETH